MPNRIDFSIIIPTHNRPKELVSCLEALENLDYPRSKFEVIVADDGSKPQIAPYVSPFLNRLNVKVCSQKKRGAASARNHGAETASGLYLVFTDDDCAPATDWLNRLAARFSASPYGIIGGRTINFLPDNIFSTASQDLIHFLYLYYNEDPDSARFLTSSNMAIRADVFRDIGGFDPEFSNAGGEDRELCDRCRWCGFKMVYAPEVVVYHKHHLGLNTFLRQHFGYGQGAFRFHKLRSRRAKGSFKIEKPSFYINLFRFPFSRGTSRKSFVVFVLFFLSQVGNAAGFFWERQKSRNCLEVDR